MNSKKYLFFTLIFLSVIFAKAQTGTIVTGDGSGENMYGSASNNTVFGDSALVNSTSADNLTVLGYHAGYSNTASENTFLGYKSGYTNTTGTDNLFVGYESGYSSTGTDNTFIGYRVGKYNTSGYDNTSIGYNAGYNQSEGHDNICMGFSAGRYVTGDKNLFIGHEVGYGATSGSTGEGNTAIGCKHLQGDYHGYYPLAYLKTGSYNTILGSGSGYSLKEGNNNTFLGHFAGERMSNSSQNTFIGFCAGNYTGISTAYEDNDNVAVGSHADDYSYNKDNSVCVGYYSDYNGNANNIVSIGGFASSDKESIAMGYYAYMAGKYGLAIGYDATSYSDGGIGLGYKHYIGSYTYAIGIGNEINIANNYTVGIGANVDIDNTNAIAIGHKAVATGDYSIAFGANTSVTGDNSIALGNGVSVSTDNTITIGNDQVTSIRGTVNWTTLSDGRYKTDVKEDVAGLDFINQLRPVSYELNSQPGIRYSGFIAQEVEAAAERVGYDFSGVKKPQNSEDFYGLRYAEFVVPLTKAVQELEVDYQKNETVIQENAKKLNEYEERIAQLKAKVELLKEQSNHKTTIFADMGSKNLDVQPLSNPEHTLTRN
ncbi:MAG: tail fiber domain-containing protein [Saprospiraceae bacterium]